MDRINKDLAESIVGRRAPREFPVLDASIMDFAESHRIIREDVKLNKVRYEFPAGLNQLELFEECRALTVLDDFEAMYDITMQLLVDKDLVIKLRNDDGTYSTLAEVHVAEKFQNLRGCPAIDKYPVLITWLTEFIAEELAKKYPLPGKNQTQPTAAKKEKGRLKDLHKPQ